MKKAQVKMFETIAILIIFFFLVGFGFIFYAKIRQTTSAQEIDETAVLKSIQIAEKSSFLPELRYSEDSVPKDSLDLYKLEILPEIIEENKIYYYDIFGYSKIVVREIYPDEKEWIIYDRQPPSFRSSTQTQIPVPIYNTISFPKEYTYGVIYVDVYN